jgi:hypothetical protein
VRGRSAHESTVAGIPLLSVPVPSTRSGVESSPALQASAAADAAEVASATAGSAAPPPPLAPEEARRLAKRAAGCLEDPRCRLDEAVRLHAEAVSAGRPRPTGACCSTLDEIACLKRCESRPSMCVDDEIHDELTPARVDEALAAVADGI